ncbi:MAG: c-type cytochrome [Porticoccaceae bacterium]
MLKLLKITTAALALGSTALLATPALAGDAAAGKAKAMMCAGCHGPAGISNNDMWPNLAGQKQGYLASSLKAYRSGERKNAMMAGMARGLSDTDIANLAAYFSSLK